MGLATIGSAPWNIGNKLAGIDADACRHYVLYGFPGHGADPMPAGVNAQRHEPGRYFGAIVEARHLNPPTWTLDGAL
jgi:hypothetical protein